MNGKEARNNTEPSHLHFFESMDRINRAIQGSEELETMMSAVLDEVLAIFECDRAALAYPCDPDADSWSAPMQRTRPEYPGIQNPEIGMPVDQEVSETFRLMLASDKPVLFGPDAEHQLPARAATHFAIQSQMSMALSPKRGKPWMFLLHQCSHPRVWSGEERRLFQEIGRRLADALNSLLYLRELQKSEERYRRFVETSNEGVTALDRDNVITFVNARMAGLLGYHTDEMLGRPLTDFLFEEDIASHRQHMALRSKGVGEIYERRFRSKSGSEVWALISATPIRSEEGEFQGSFGMLSDITMRKRTEQALREKQALLLETQSIAHMGSWHMDLATNEVFWSEELYRMYGFDSSQPPPLYTESAKLFTPASWELLSSSIANAVETGTPYEIELEMVPKTGGRKWMLARGELVRDTHGNPVRVRGVVLDITRQHELDDQLRQAQKMEAIGTLVGGIAHDFNNKLAAINGNLYLALFDIADNSKAAGHLKAIEQLSFEAADMVRQLLTFARKGTVKMSPLNLVSFIKETAKFNRVTIPEDIQLSINYGNRPLQVLGDITQLQQLFLNLLTNARDALQGVEQARIDVVLEYLEPDTLFLEHHPEAESVTAFACLKVSDNGAGIEPQYLKQIFDPFFTTKESGKGTGLGLAMVYGVAQSHHGIVEVESKPGEGTCFSIYLPLHSETEKPSEPEQQNEIIRGNGETILLADDDASVLETFANMLESIGYRVLQARNGREAVEMFRQHAEEIDLVILDMVMPEMKGYQVAERIRDIDPDIRLLFATGYDSSPDVGDKVGDIEVLAKPFLLNQVSRTIHRILAGE